MFLKYLDRMRKTIGFRLTILYSSILLGSFLILFTSAYFYLSLSLQRYDRDIIQTELNECVNQFQKGGLEALQKEVLYEKHMTGSSSYFVRLAGPQNKTIFIDFPDEINKLDISLLERKHISSDIEWFELQVDDDILEIASMRLADGNVLQVGKNAVSRAKLLQQFYVNSAIAIILLIVLSFGGGMLLSSRTLRPLRRLSETLRSIIETGKMDVCAPTSKTGDEMDALATLFNVLLEKINSLITGMEGSLDNIAHDLRTPLTRLTGIAETALRSEQNPEGLREALIDCIEESKRIDSMLITLMDISEADAGAMKLNLNEVNLLELIEKVVELYQYVAEEKNIYIHYICDKEIQLTVDPIRMRQVLANLIDNALKYTSSGGRVDIEACNTQNEIIISIRDTGTGISSEELPKVWNRLYRGDESRSQRGLGLGLSLVKAIVQAHNGRVDLLSEPGVGSIFSIYLPKKH